MSRRSFLFLQGVCSPFFFRLADQLAADGHRVYRVNFNGGDAACWGRQPAWGFRGSLDTLPSFLDGKFRSFDITDLVLFGDKRPVHLSAIQLARARGIRIHVFEEGYFRPHWVTLERGGVNGNSLLPRNPDWFREVGKSLPDYGHGVSFRSSLRVRAMHDMAYHLASLVNPLLFPHYHTHAPYIAGVEYAGLGRRFATLPFHERRDRIVVERLIRGPAPFFLLPLQLESDAQIRDHSQFKRMSDVIEHVMSSFAVHAPTDARLVIKNHPLDAGFMNYPRLIRRLKRRFDMDGRIEYMETGDVSAMLAHARGLVTVNSTLGESSLMHGCPTMTLSNPIYNLPGLTFRGSLNAFWRDGTAPDAELFRRFRNTVIHTTQVNGGFYSSEGIELAVTNSRQKLEAERSPLEALL
jgi:capsular polysaccharide export protein